MALAKEKSTLRKKKIARTISHVKIYIQSSFNNTITTITDPSGNVLAWASAGGSGFKGARKSTPYAAQITLKNALDKTQEYNIQSAEVMVSGVGSGREAAVRALKGTNINVTSIRDITPIPHNGCRPKKPRRV